MRRTCALWGLSSQCKNHLFCFLPVVPRAVKIYLFCPGAAKLHTPQQPWGVARHRGESCVRGHQCQGGLSTRKEGNWLHLGYRGQWDKGLQCVQRGYRMTPVRHGQFLGKFTARAASTGVETRFRAPTSRATHHVLQAGFLTSCVEGAPHSKAPPTTPQVLGAGTA